MIKWVSRGLGRPCRLHRDCRLEPRLTNSRWIHGSRPEPVGRNWGRTDGIAKRRKRSAAKRAARSRSAQSRVEAGNGPSDPVERRGCRAVDGELEPRRGHRASPACHRETTQSCEGQRIHSVTNRVHLTCTPGSVGDLAGDHPGLPGPMRPPLKRSAGRSTSPSRRFTPTCVGSRRSLDGRSRPPLTRAASLRLSSRMMSGGRSRMVSLEERNASGLPPRGAAALVCLFPGAAGVHAGVKPPPLPGNTVELRRAVPGLPLRPGPPGILERPVGVLPEYIHPLGSKAVKRLGRRSPTAPT